MLQPSGVDRARAAGKRRLAHRLAEGWVSVAGHRDILRGSGSDIQIVGAAMKRYAASKDKDIHKLMQYAERLRVKPKVLRYMEILL